MSEKIDSPRPDWVPLARAPFLFRRRLQHGEYVDGTPDHELCRSVVALGCCKLGIDSEKAQLRFEAFLVHVETGAKHRPIIQLELDQIFAPYMFLTALNVNMPDHEQAIQRVSFQMYTEYCHAVDAGVCQVHARIESAVA